MISRYVMWRESQRSTATLLASLGVGAAAYLSLAGGYPSLTSPHSMVVVLPGLFVWAWFDGAEPRWLETPGFLLAFVVPITVTTYFWLAGIRRGRAQVPLRSWVLFGLLVLSVPSYFGVSWSGGLEYQGSRTTVGLAAFNALALVVLAILARISVRRASWQANLRFQAGLLLFCAWSAFPWLGETP